MIACYRIRSHSLPLFLLVAAAGATQPGCTCSRGGPPPEAGRDFGDFASPPPDPAPYLAMARAILDQRGRTAVSAPPPAPGRRVALAVWRAGGDAWVATANGPTLADSVAEAADALAPKVKDAAHVRLELDVVSGVAAVDLSRDPEVELPSIGMQGVLVTRDDAKTGVVLPGEIVQRGMFHSAKPEKLDHDRVGHLLSERAGVADVDVPAMRAYLFSADAHVESAAHDRVHTISRGMVEHPAQVTPEALVEAVRSGADYLVRVTDDQGRYVYLYQPATDHDDSSYGWLRHAGTTYAIFEAYEELGAPLYLAKGERALAYLKAHLRDDAKSQGKYALDTTDEEQQKVGGAGLALLAFTKHAAVTGQRAEMETMRALARLILAEQYDDGHFRANVDLERETGKKGMKREPVYYVGEAVLGLMRLYALDPQQAYLDSARRAADWVVRVRDAYVSEDNQEHDHWISYAFNDLYRVTHDEAYAEHASKIARAIAKKVHREGEAPAPDWVGTFYEGQTTPGSTRAEAYDADVALARFAGKPETWLLEQAKRVAMSMLGQQFGPENDYFLPNQAKAAGGVRESLFVQDIRIDYVQHAISAWLHLARILRDPSYGKTGVPSQDPVR